MNKGQLLVKAIERSLNKELFTANNTEFSRCWTIPVSFSHKGESVNLDLQFKSECKMIGDSAVSEYQENVIIYNGKDKSSAKLIPFRWFVVKEKFDAECSEALIEMLDGINKEMIFTKGDLTKFVKQQTPATEENTTNIVVTEKRGRGRPKKIQTEMASETPKRGRGRPKKESVTMVELSVLNS